MSINLLLLDARKLAHELNISFKSKDIQYASYLYGLYNDKNYSHPYKLTDIYIWIGLIHWFKNSIDKKLENYILEYVIISMNHQIESNNTFRVNKKIFYV